MNVSAFMNDMDSTLPSLSLPHFDLDREIYQNQLSSSNRSAGNSLFQ